MLLWLVVFGVTYILELPIYALGLRGSVAFARVVFVALVLNLATHPVVWFVLPKLFANNQIHYVLVAEAFAVTVEGVLLWLIARWQRWPERCCSWLWCTGLAFVANAFSAALGEVGYTVLEGLGVSLT
jgi:hypothetical protein